MTVRPGRATEVIVIFAETTAIHSRSLIDLVRFPSHACHTSHLGEFVRNAGLSEYTKCATAPRALHGLPQTPKSTCHSRLVLLVPGTSMEDNETFVHETPLIGLK